MVQLRAFAKYSVHLQYNQMPKDGGVQRNSKWSCVCLCCCDILVQPSGTSRGCAEGTPSSQP